MSNTIKTADDYFRDWELDAFGYGYGTGEPYIVTALKGFMALFPDEAATYKYEELEIALGHTVAWLLICRLCRIDIIEYGCSPRYGWLTTQGKRLHNYIQNKTVDELVSILNGWHDYDYCYPNACNCDGWEPDKICQNPFWLEKARAEL